MSHIENQSIPKTGFGLCRWCNEENQRLQYLMCSKCFRIANMLPSKTMVLLNRPEIKKRLGEEGATIRNIAPELRKFILDPKCRFPSEISDQNQWKTMQKVAVDNVTKTEVRQFLQEIVSKGYPLPPTDKEVIAIVGLDILLRFILHVSVIRGLLKIAIAQDENDFFHHLCQDCMDNAILNDPTQGLVNSKPSNEIPTQDIHAGMKVRDLILKKLEK